MIPVLDLGRETPAQLATRIDEALAGDGFYAVVNHGVPQSVVDAAFDAGHRFFALAESVKALWHIDRWTLKRGFDPIGWQSLDPGNPPDVKESFYLGVKSLCTSTAYWGVLLLEKFLSLGRPRHQFAVQAKPVRTQAVPQVRT